MPNKSIFAIAATVLSICLPIAQPVKAQSRGPCYDLLAANTVERAIKGGATLNAGLQVARTNTQTHDGTVACDQAITGALIQRGVLKPDTTTQGIQPIKTDKNNPVANGCTKFSDLMAMADKGVVAWRCEGGSMYIQRL